MHPSNAIDLENDVSLNVKVESSVVSLLLKQGLIGIDQYEVARIEKEKSDASLEEILVDLGFVSEAIVQSTIAQEWGYNEYSPDREIVDVSLLSALNKEDAIAYGVLPLSRQDKKLHVAMRDVFDIKAIDFLRKKYPESPEIVGVLAKREELLQSINQHFAQESSIADLIGVLEKSADLNEDSLETLAVQFINAVILDAVMKKASDIHFEPEGIFIRLRYRIDGVMRQICAFHGKHWGALCVRLKILSNMNIAELRKPQDGRMGFHVAGRDVDFRVSIHPTIHGENIVIRILDKFNALMPLEDLGFSDLQVSDLKKVLQEREGLVILTGPTGSGKTTTLYSMLEYMSCLDLNIMTLEEPIEYELPLIRQTNVRSKTGLTYADGIKSILRQDPDIIFVGEIRDEMTAQMALRAAMTGHLVFTTLHTNDSFGVPYRLMDLGISPLQLSGNMVAILAQRLLRLLCPECRKQKQVSEEEAALLECDAPQTIYEATGCAACHYTGYVGRKAIGEILSFDTELDELIAHKATRRAYHQYAQEKELPLLFDHAIDMIKQGQTSISEARRVVNLGKGRRA